MGNVQVKGVNDHLLFLMNDEVSDEACLLDLEKILISPSFQKDGFYVKGYFDYGKKEFTKERFCNLMNILKKTQCVLFCGLNEKTETRKNMVHKKGIIRNGEVVSCDEDLLFNGRINPGGHLIVHGKLYLLGKCAGKIEVLGRDALINASCLEHACLQINGQRIEDISVESLTMFYEDQETIRCTREDDRVWQEQL